MKFSTVSTISFEGIKVFEITVECQIVPGIPSFTIVGLADKSISESKERIRSAFFSLGIPFPMGKVIINLSPAGKEKEGTHYDLPILIALLRAVGEIHFDFPGIFMGEVGLGGNLLETSGVLQAAIFCKEKDLSLILSSNYLEQLEYIPHKISCIYGDNLENLLKNIKEKNFFFTGNKKIQEESEPYTLDFIIGQTVAKRCLTIAAAGRHHILMVGKQGVGKSTLAKAIKCLLPNLTEEEALETNSIYNMAGFTKNWLVSPPFRSPHSSSSLTSIMGGGTYPKPGEISLAHNGILFLDELPEFNGQIVDGLRTPLEEYMIHISRAKYKVTYPANIQLIISMNPCKCGLLLEGDCKCSKKNYMEKLSSPIKDRIDLHIILTDILNKNLCKKENFPNPKENIIYARKMQIDRFSALNSRVETSDLVEKGNFTKEAMNFLNKNYSGSMRNYYKIMRIGRTIADLEKSQVVLENHLAEASIYRRI